ncbi:hypothetical protein K493DRAFT_225727, partial [Basidiobolus meristosporus CBS 931.73]
STWNDRFFEFATFVFIMDIFKDTLLPSSLYGFVFTASGILFSSVVGKWIDCTARLQAIRTLIPVKRISNVLASLGFLVLFTYFDYEAIPEDAKPLCYTIFGLIVATGGALKLSSVGVSIVVEKDWLVMMAQSNSAVLTRVNSIMRRIELVSKMVTPLMFGFVVAAQSPRFCVLFIGFWSAISMFLELHLIQKVYDCIPCLSEDKELMVGHYLGVPTGDDMSGADEDPSDTLSRNHKHHTSYFKRVYRDWLIYYNHPIFAVSLSYAMIYMSVLSIAGTMVSWLKWKGYSDSHIGGMRSIMTLLAIVGTFLMPLMSRRWGLMKTAQVSLILEWLALIPVICSFFIYQSWFTGVLLIAGISLSRMCVWIFDLSQMQILQENVTNSQTGLIHGWHFTLCNLFDLGQFLLTMIWSDPQLFKIPATISFLMIFLAACTFSR